MLIGLVSLALRFSFNTFEHRQGTLIVILNPPTRHAVHGPRWRCFYLFRSPVG